MPKEAEVLEYALSIDIRAMIVSMVIIAAAGITVWALIKKIQEITGIETKSMRAKRVINETINAMKDEIQQMKTNRENDNHVLDQRYAEIMAAIDRLNSTIEKKEAEDMKRVIEDMRWRILDFANAIRGGRKYGVESYNHVIEIFDEYEQLLKDNNMENGRVTIAMRIIKEYYENGMRDGFPV